MDHTSKTQFLGLQERLQEILHTFSESPLAILEGLTFVPDDFAGKCKGTSGDHAADQIKSHALIKNWKDSVTER